eukprot:CAMPEP_0204898756 /NCGR_PEP_ID=MMETSP1397-20131031/1471_1 /ASSEMBLY_ACC=CAM_ASM_000891 /TAXON_ID=49980 /ORGANISM="Climacostomum Climacostomum virens, Strain Stock W-24" /LENGTH=1954 /DNA_ID=CAMNT_0052066641 /DNA_START=214 /DNA_END=6078 /DNA_ORIENTATION=+
MKPDGAIKKVDDLYVHVLCALFSPCFIVEDFTQMRLRRSVVPMPLVTTGCAICKSQTHVEVSCKDCGLSAHLGCALESQEWYVEIPSLTVYCSTHRDSNEKFCICRQTNGQGSFMIACDLCNNWFHGSCIGLPAHAATADNYVCKYCNEWSSTKPRLLKEDNTGKRYAFSLTPPLVHFWLDDWWLVARILSRRVDRVTTTAARLEELKELSGLVQQVHWIIPRADLLAEKLSRATVLLEPHTDLLKNLDRPLKASEVRRLQQVVAEAEALPLQLPHADKIARHLAIATDLLELESITKHSQKFTLQQAKALEEQVTHKLPFSDHLTHLSTIIKECDSWFATLRSQFNSKTKMKIKEAKEQIEIGKALPLLMPQEIGILQGEIEAVDMWDAKYKKMSQPFSQTELVQMLEEAKICTIETEHMEAANALYEEFKNWTEKWETLQQAKSDLVTVQAFFKAGEAIDKHVSVQDYLNSLKTHIDNALQWQAAAHEVLSTQTSPHRVAQMLREAKELIVTFPEEELLEKRAGINKKISEVLHRKHKEEDLPILLQEAKDLSADDEFLKAIENRIEAVAELKKSIHAILNSYTIENPAEVFSKLLEDLKVSRTDLPEERARLESGMKSLQWQISFHQGPTEQKKEQEWLRNSVAKASKLIYMHPDATKVYQEAVAKLWEHEHSVYMQAEYITSEQFFELESKAFIVKNKPPAMEAFLTQAAEVRDIVKGLEQLADTPITQVMADSSSLKTQLAVAQVVLQKHRISFPEHCSKVLSWQHWLEWCIKTEVILNSLEQPSINQLYELNEEVMALGIPHEVPTLKALNSAISYYESWLYRYTSYASTRKFYVNLSCSISDYTRRAAEKQKPPKAMLDSLISDAGEIKVECTAELQILKADQAFADNWKNKTEAFFERQSYQDLLARAKKSFKSIEAETLEEFYNLVKECCFEVFVEIDDYSAKLCAYEWNLSAHRLLQSTEKVAVADWDQLFGALEYLNRSHIDNFTFDRFKRQQSLRQQIEEEIRRLKDADGKTAAQKTELSDLEMLGQQLRACRLQVSEEQYVTTLEHRVQGFNSQLEMLLSQKAQVQSFKDLAVELQKLPVSLPQANHKIKEVLDKMAALTVRVKILRESAASYLGKVDKGKAEQVLAEYRDAPATLAEAENLQVALEEAKKFLKEVNRVVESETSSLEELNSISAQLDSQLVHMGQEEQVAKFKLWKLKIRQLHETKVPFQVLLGWYNEGLQKREFDDAQESLMKLERLVRKGEELKSRLSACQTMQELERLTFEAKDLPFDLTQHVIEQKTRISYMKEKPKEEQKRVPETDAYLPSKRVMLPNMTEDFYYGSISKEGHGDSLRLSCVNVIENLILKGSRGLEQVEKRSKKLAAKLEELCFQKGNSKDYKQSIEHLQRVLTRLQDFGGFTARLFQGQITPEDLITLEPRDCDKPSIIRRLFRGEPPVLVYFSKSTLKSDSQQQPSKRQKTAELEKKKQNSMKDLISSLKPKMPAQTEPSSQKSEPIKKPASFSVNSFLSQMKEFQKKEQIPPPDKDVKMPVKIAMAYVPLPEEMYEEAPARTKRSSDSWVDPHKAAKLEELFSYEGRFSSDEEEKAETPADTSQEYNVLDYAKKTDTRRRKKKSKLYDPFKSNTPKTKAPQGSLLKVWTGKVDYNRQTLGVDLYSVDSLNTFQRMPQLPNKLTIQGRTKQSDFEVYISQNSNSSVNRSLITGWIEPSAGQEREFAELAHDLKSKDRAAVIRVDASLTIYLTNLTDSFLRFLDGLKVNICQNLDQAIARYIAPKPKLGCVMFFKKTAASSSAFLAPTVILEAADGKEEKEFEMSPITSEDEAEVEEKRPETVVASVFQEALDSLSKTSSGNQNEIMSDLRRVVETMTPDQIANLGPNSQEISQLISVIREQVENSQTPSGVTNMSQFLSQQVPYPPTYNYSTRPVYPSYYKPPSPKRGSRFS